MIKPKKTVEGLANVFIEDVNHFTENMKSAGTVQQQMVIALTEICMELKHIRQVLMTKR